MPLSYLGWLSDFWWESENINVDILVDVSQRVSGVATVVACVGFVESLDYDAEKDRLYFNFSSFLLHTIKFWINLGMRQVAALSV